MAKKDDGWRFDVLCRPSKPSKAYKYYESRQAALLEWMSSSQVCAYGSQEAPLKQPVTCIYQTVATEHNFGVYAIKVLTCTHTHLSWCAYAIYVAWDGCKFLCVSSVVVCVRRHREIFVPIRTGGRRASLKNAIHCPPKNNFRLFFLLYIFKCQICKK